MRLETGTLAGENDWPGIFIRGDNALIAYAPALKALLNGEADTMQRAICKSLLNLLMSADTQEPEQTAKIIRKKCKQKTP